MFPFMAQSFQFLICRSLKYTWARRARRARGHVGHAIKQTPTTPAF